MRRREKKHKRRHEGKRQKMGFEAFALEDADLSREKSRARDLKASQWWKRQTAKGICHYCKKSFPPSELTMDHIIPMGRGGKSTRNNVVPACKACNTKKKDDLPFPPQECSPKEPSR